MREAERIADQVRCSIEGEAWHGPAVLELLAEVTAAQASRHPAKGAHSIWEIVLHIRAWNAVVLRRIRGEVVEMTDADDWPPVPDSSDETWDDLIRSLTLAHSKVYNAVLGMKDSKLNETVPGKPYNFYHMLHGLAQHNLYHAGKIALIKKIG